MDQDTPDLFDSEPVSVNLTVAKSNTEVNTDDILAEIIEEIDDTRASNVDNNEADDQVQEEPMEEFHTDESDIENEDGDTINIQLNGDGVDESVDQSTELQGEEPTKTKAVHKGLPPGRVKLIMKMDPDVHLVASDAVFILTKATVPIALKFFNNLNTTYTYCFSCRKILLDS